MELGWGANGERFRADLVAFLEEHAPTGVERAAAVDGDALIPRWAREWQATLFDHGWLVPSNPPGLGGRDATDRHTALFLDELARRDLPRSMHFAGYGIAAPSLLQFGTPAQQALAPAALRGDTVWCIGMSEPDAGSDLASLRTRAEVFEDHFVITGQKVWTSYAPVADMCLCYARTDPDEPRHGGISALLVDMATPGVSVRPLTNIGGMVEFAEVFFEGARVPRDALLGDLHGGWRVTQGALGHERSTMWMEAVARVEQVLGDLTAGCLAAGLHHDPVVRRAVAERHAQVRSLEALGYASMAGTGPQALYMKLASSELYSELLELGTDLLGPGTDLLGHDTDLLGHGTGLPDPGMPGHEPAMDLPLPREWGHDFLRGLAGTLAGGTSEVQRDLIARHALGLPRPRT